MASSPRPASPHQAPPGPTRPYLDARRLFSRAPFCAPHRAPFYFEKLFGRGADPGRNCARPRPAPSICSHAASDVVSSPFIPSVFLFADRSTPPPLFNSHSRGKATTFNEILCCFLQVIIVSRSASLLLTRRCSNGTRARCGAGARRAGTPPHALRVSRHQVLKILFCGISLHPSNIKCLNSLSTQQAKVHRSP